MDAEPSCTEPRKLTELKFVNLFETEVRGPKGSHPWVFASRKSKPGADVRKPDAVVVLAVIRGAGEPQLVLTREYRAPLGGYEISVPSGLVDADEDPAEAARRELREETGLSLDRVLHVSPALASSAGLTDETVSLVYAEASGELSKEHLEQHEMIETRLYRASEIRELLESTSDIISSRIYSVLLQYALSGTISFPAFKEGGRK